MQKTKAQLRPIPAIVGPTASGKSDLGIAIAQAFDGEIINMDSIQAYRGIYRATAKLSPEERKGIPHHLIDIVDPHENFTAGDYARLAFEAVIDIESRGRIAILVGGSGFYLRALVRPLFEGPKTDPDLRKRLVAMRDKHGPEFLYRMLKRVDPHAAAASTPRNWSRTMRALEVYFQTGRRISDLQPCTPEPPELASRIKVIALNPPREELYARINERADRMFEGGLVEEVESLLARGVPPDAKAFQAHGYRRVVEYLQGLRSRDDALNQMKLDTRHYAKRQLTWWRAWPEVKWIDRFGFDWKAVEEAIEFLRPLISTAAW